MKMRSVATVVLLVVLSAPALAQKSRQVRPTCVDQRSHYSFTEMLFSTGPAPQANGCAPAVYSGGRFVGQDPDPNIRLQLRRDSDNEGYYNNHR